MRSHSSGFGLIELMIGTALGLLVISGVLVVFIAQRQVYQNATSQALIQDADNALSAIITPVIRGSGFAGCGSIGSGILSYQPSRNTPLTFDTSSAVKGFKANSIPSPLIDGALNDTTSSDWSPALDASFLTAAVGGVTQGSDVLVLIGGPPGAASTGVSAFGTGAITITNPLTTSSYTFAAPQLVAVSDCGKASVFQINSGGGTSSVLNYSLGPNGTPVYPVSSQVIPIQQTAFYVAKGNAGQSALFQAVMQIPTGGSSANATWGAPREIIPGVLNMQVLYGIGTGGRATRYVDASGVADFTTVTTVKLGFLIEGNPTSAVAKTNQTSFPLFTNTLSVPADSRLRHTFYLTVNTRNSTL